jgi:uncharacterized membrane protein YdbT with pleckstrin-like domain
MELHESEQLIWRGHPSARSSVAWYLKWGFLAILPAVIAGIFKANDRGTGIAYWKWTVISIGLLALVIVIDVLRRAAIDYVVTNQRIRIRRGILSRREQSTLVERVQNINTTQSLIDRLLSVGAVDFDTAGTEAKEASFRFVGVSSPHDLVRRFEAHITALRQSPAN